MRAETCARRAETIPTRADPIPARTNPCGMGTIGCDFGNRPKIAVGSRQQSVGRGRKEKKISEVGEIMSRGGREKGRFWRWNRGVPITHPGALGAIPKKAFRIQPVISPIHLSASRFTTTASCLPTNVKMLQFFEQVRGSWLVVRGLRAGKIFAPLPWWASS